MLPSVEGKRQSDTLTKITNESSVCLFGSTGLVIAQLRLSLVNKNAIKIHIKKSMSSMHIGQFKTTTIASSAHTI